MKNIITIIMMTVIAANFLVLEARSNNHSEEIVYNEPNWYFGLTGAANLNFYRGTTHRLSDDLLLPATFHDGFGIKPNIAGFVEYRFDDMWGLTLNLGNDGRGGVFDEVMAPCDLLSELETKLSYLVIEPSVRFTPFGSGFHLFAGPRLSMNLNKDFIYQREIQHSDPVEYLKVEDEFSEIRNILLSLQIGAGYDFMISPASKKMKYVLTPFVSFHPYFGQVPRDIETWSITAVRAGLTLKIGRGSLEPIIIDPEPPVVEPEKPVDPEVPEIAITEPPVVFNAFAPLAENSIISNEVYPLRNIMFFDAGSTAIPNRYTLLSAAEAQRFSEENLQDQRDISRRNQNNNQMIIYYNILNILGDRMRNYPNTTITLAGFSAGQGQERGKQQAESIKNYLVSVFNISAQRIRTTGADWPEHRSFRHSQQSHADLRLDSDRRVEIFSDSKELLMGDAGRLSGILKPFIIAWPDEDKRKDNVTFSLTNAERYMNEWNVELTDPQGLVIQFGPFKTSSENVPGYKILEQGSEGIYNVVMRGVTKEGVEISDETSFELHQGLIQKVNVIRFSMLYNFDVYETPAPYRQFLIENVAPLVPANSRVIIHGHADVIGTPEHNHSLSLQRARDAKNMIENALISYEIHGVEFEVYGFGEMTDQAPFQNRLPEGRFYNRTVIIDIIPR